MKIKYHDFLKAVLDCNHDPNTPYDIETLEIRSTISFGIGFIDLLNMFIEKCGFNSKEICFHKTLTKFYPNTIVFINRCLAEKFIKYDGILPMDTYHELGRKLIVEIN